MGFKKKFVCFILVLFVLVIGASGCSKPEQKKANDGESQAELKEDGGAEQFPAKPITLIVPAAPGGGFDTVARPLAQVGTQYLGVPVVIKNIAGVAFTLGATELVKSAPDGYTLMFSSITPLVQKTVEVDYGPEDFDYICTVDVETYAWAVNSNLPINNVDELFEYMRQNPGKLVAPWTGSEYTEAVLLLLQEISGGEFRIVTTTSAAEGAAAVGGGHMDFYLGSYSAIEGLADAGLVKVILTYPYYEDMPVVREGTPTLADYPELEEQYLKIPDPPKFISLPTGVPEERMQILEDAFHQVYEDEGFQALAKKLGLVTKWFGREEVTKKASDYLAFIEEYYKNR